MQTTPEEFDRLTADLPVDAATAAFHLDITRRSLDDLIAGDPDFPVHRLGSGPKAHRRFYRSELDAWIRSRCSDRTPDQTTRPPTSSTVAA